MNSSTAHLPLAAIRVATGVVRSKHDCACFAEPERSEGTAK